MLPGNPWKSYKLVSTQTASPGQLVLMLYDGAIRAAEAALAGFDQDDPLEMNLAVNNNILKAQEILAELNGALDLERGGELAQVLRRIYEYVDDRLQESNVRKTPAGVKEATTRLTTLRDAWREMLSQRTPQTELGPGALRGGLCVCG